MEQSESYRHKPNEKRGYKRITEKEPIKEKDKSKFFSYDDYNDFYMHKDVSFKTYDKKADREIIITVKEML